MRQFGGLGTVLLALVAAGCGEGLFTQAAGSEVELCDDLITATLIGELSEDPEIAEHQIERAEMGLDTDISFVTSLTDPSVEAEREIWPVPIHPDELRYFESGGHTRAVEDSMRIVAGYGEAQRDTYSGMSIVRWPELYLEVGFTDDLDAHHDALNALMGPNVKVRVEEAPHSRSSLEAAAAQIADALSVRTNPGYTVDMSPSVRVAPGRYLIQIGVTDWPGANVVDAVAAVPRDAWDMVCIRHTEIPRG